MGSFGDRLRKEREQRGISLDDIALTTKIRAGLLQALEEEKFDRLPGGIFNKGFVRAYARHLGIDEDQAIADYMVAVGEAPSRRPVDSQSPARDETPEPRIQLVKEEREPVPSSLSPTGVLAGLLVLVVVGAAAWFYYHREKRIESQATSAPPAASSEPSASVRQTPATVPAPPPASASSSQKSQSPAAAIPTTGGPASPASSVMPASGAITVRIRADEDCWMQITADGKMEEITLAGQTEKTVSAHNTVVLKAGNVGALEISFNGQKLATQGDYGQVRTLTFGPEGLRPTQPATPPPLQ